MKNDYVLNDLVGGIRECTRNYNSAMQIGNIDRATDTFVGFSDIANKIKIHTNIPACYTILDFRTIGMADEIGKMIMTNEENRLRRLGNGA